MNRILGLALVLAACGSATAATLKQLNMDQMTQSATSIVRARVTSSSASFTGPTIYTHYKLQVSEIWKGSGASEVVVPGGVAAGYRQSYPGVPGLQAGAEYVLFLWTSPTTGITHLVGFSQGLFNVVPRADGSIQASRPLIGEGMHDANGRIVRDQAVQMPIAAMKTRVAATVAAGTSR
jgi:hypothetical protein